MYSTAEIAKRIGTSTAFLRKQIAQNGLRAMKKQGHRIAISHDEVIRWLIRINLDSQSIRRLFPLPGPLACVAVRTPWLCALHMERPRSFGSLFEAAIAMNGITPWGLLVDLETVGASHAAESLASFAKLANRPTLIGLHGDVGGRAIGESVFDFLIPDRLPFGLFAQRIRAIRPWGK